LHRNIPSVRILKTGTKSLLFGVHQFFIHPLTVYAAWVWLYRSLPSWRETVCIAVHDWGYWGKANMDDEDGERHPELGAKIAGRMFGPKYHDLCLYHSRHYARNAGQEPSILCWADKLSILFERSWTYLPRAWASGELFEYRRIAADTRFIPLAATHRQWFTWIQGRLSALGRDRRADVVFPYVNPAREGK
jgi:hypothetical protein